MEKIYDIKFVAIYLRKSRGDEDKDLEKHKKTLTDICLKNNWKYILYQEIGTGDSVEARPKMQKLLKDIKDQTYDAVIVMDYDRLGRGDLSDQAKIKSTLVDSSTFIVTPNKIYDLANDTDDMLSDIQGFIARQEYKMIKKRLLQGKKIGAKLGNWTNGIPPYPYVYNANTKGLIVDEEKRENYRFIIDSYLKGVTPQKIAWNLNKRSILSPQGKQWSNVAIYRILKDETHLGKIISNKSEGSGHKNKKTKPLKYFPRSEWTIVENCHEALKTEEEHNNILYLLNKNKIVPKRSRKCTYSLTGLVRCGICGASMSFVKKEKYNYLFIKPCYKHDNYGNKCINKGGKVEYVLDSLLGKLIEFKKEFNNINDYEIKKSSNEILSQINEIKKNIQKKEQAIERIDEAFESGIYGLDKYNQRIQKANKEMDDLKEVIVGLEQQLKNIQNKEQTKILVESAISILRNEDKVPPEEINRSLKKIVNRIFWTRVDKDNIKIDIEFN